MFYPPSLSEAVLTRAFHAYNGELGVMPHDVPGFLDACETDGVQLHGWEFWIVDHQPSADFSRPMPAPGFWFGGIPMLDSPIANIIHGEGDIGDIRRALPAIKKSLAQVHPNWAPHVRVNFSFD